MDRALELVKSLPPSYVIASAALVVVLALILLYVRSRSRFARRVLAFLAIPGERHAVDHFADAELLRRSRQIERLAARHGTDVIRALRLDELWAARLAAKERPADFRRVITFAADKGLFACFLAALRNARLARELSGYLSIHGDFLVLRKLALSGRGEEFDGSRARDFFHDRIDEVREMTGDPEWPSRYFAVKILVHDDDERSRRTIIDALRDPHPLVRRTTAAECRPADREGFYGQLVDLLTHDPVYEVRCAARDRIRRSFQDLYRIDPRELSAEEAAHLVELLDPENPDDENAAVEFLSGADLELRLPAARFLVRSGRLEARFLSVEFADRTDLDRTRMLLLHALEVNVVGFLEGLRRNPRPATLLLAAELLERAGPVELIVELAERVFRMQEELTRDHLDTYEATARCIGRRGSEAAQQLLARELTRRRGSPDLLRRALAAVPSGRDHLYRDTLLQALRDPSFPEREALRGALLRLDQPTVLHEALGLVTASRESVPHPVRIDALTLLGELRLPYALQEILEHLPTLPIDAAREFARILQDYQPQLFERKVRTLLAGVDGSIRAALITALPGTGKKTFLPEIRAALGDASPDVRIAATWALVDYGETRSLNQAVDMLRDPVERVRCEVARALATGGGKSAVEALYRTLADPNEVDSVKRSAIEGLGRAASGDAVDVLVRVLERGDDFVEAAQRSLAAHPTGTTLRRLVEHVTDGDPELRDRIAVAFTLMGEAGEEAVRELLDRGIASLRPYLADILEQTGYVESRIRALTHRSPDVRRGAAELLAKIASKAAYRGIVLAARDPDSEVRVQVIKALEQLDSDEGREILESLENDPDRRVRTYTHWAVERLRAKKL